MCSAVGPTSLPLQQPGRSLHGLPGLWRHQAGSAGGRDCFQQLPLHLVWPFVQRSSMQHMSPVCASSHTQWVLHTMLIAFSMGRWVLAGWCCGPEASIIWASRRLGCLWPFNIGAVPAAGRHGAVCQQPPAAPCRACTKNGAHTATPQSVPCIGHLPA